MEAAVEPPRMAGFCVSWQAIPGSGPEKSSQDKFFFIYNKQAND